MKDNSKRKDKNANPVQGRQRNFEQSKNWGGNYTPLEIELAKMAYRYRCKIAEMAESKALMFDALFSAYCALQNSPFGADLLHKRAATLASQSKAHIAEAVKLDNQLKELINDGTGESKDSGGNGEA